MKKNEVHVWNIVLPKSPKKLNYDNLHQYQNERRLIVKKLLSTYLSLEIDKINIQTNSAGKPFLSEHQLQFNVSHTQNQLFIALHPDKTIGIDVEYLSNRNIRLFAERFWGNNWFKRELESHPHYLHRIGFYKAWTQTESWVKAQGETIFNFSKFEPKVFPLFSSEIHHHHHLLFSFMPQSNLMASLCLDVDIKSFLKNKIDLSSPSSYQAILQGKDLF
jgi:4'-phosphopantetheinyl transferase